mgnify:CR=1 FL=1
MNDFHDPELERLFGRNSGPTPDVDVAYQRVQGRVRQVKRRRAVVVSGAACSLLFAVAVFAGARSDGNNSVQPGGSGTGADGSPLTVADSSDASVPTSDSSSTVSTTPDGTTRHGRNRDHRTHRQQRGPGRDHVSAHVLAGCRAGGGGRHRLGRSL